GAASGGTATSARYVRRPALARAARPAISTKATTDTGGSNAQRGPRRPYRRAPQMARAGGSARGSVTTRPCTSDRITIDGQKEGIRRASPPSNIEPGDAAEPQRAVARGRRMDV